MLGPRYRSVLLTIIVFAAVTACNARVRSIQPSDPDPDPYDVWRKDSSQCIRLARGDRANIHGQGCALSRRPVRSWGPPPREDPPVPQCPMFVRTVESGVIAEPLTEATSFDPLPWVECVPAEYLVGTRRAIRVGDGWLVAYSAYSKGRVFWASDDGSERRDISTARIAGFARTPSGSVLALAVGPARLGRGGVLVFDREGRGEYVPRLIATLPLEPSPVAFADGGTLVGFAQGFIFRVDPSGNVENVHYVARRVGHVASIARGADGAYYLGLECGILRVMPAARPSPALEEWWSARNGASGRWLPCVDG